MINWSTWRPLGFGEGVPCLKTFAQIDHELLFIFYSNRIAYIFSGVEKHWNQIVPMMPIWRRHWRKSWHHDNSRVSLTDIGKPQTTYRLVIVPAQWTLDAIMSLLRQNDVTTSFWRNNDVVIASGARWEVALSINMLETFYGITLTPHQRKGV